MRVQGFLLTIGVFFISLYAGGNASFPCMDLNGIYSNGTDSALCIFIRLQNGYCVVDGSWECDSSLAVGSSYGCQNSPSAPYISHEPVGSLPFYAVGQSITLICNTDNGNVASYVWFEDGTVITGENSRTLTVSENPAPNTSILKDYRCQYVTDGANSTVSSEYRAGALESFNMTWSFSSTVPVLMGVPNDRLVDGMLLDLSCVNFPIDGYSLEWYLDDVLFATTVNSNVFYDFEINDTTADAVLKCNFTFDSLSVTFPESGDVVIPTLYNRLPDIVVTLENNHFSTGDSAQLSCDFAESAFPDKTLSALDVTYAWHVNGTVVTQFITKMITVSFLDPAIHHGEWSCSIQLNGGTPMVSSSLFVYVDGSLEVQISTVPGIPIMGGSLFILCHFLYPHAEDDLTVHYHWMVNNTAMEGFTEDFLYVYPVTGDVTGTYTCTITMETVRSATGSMFVQYPVSFQAPAPSLSVMGIGADDDLTFGTNLLECDYGIDYATFGINVTFFKDGVLMYPDGPGMAESGTQEDTCPYAISYNGTFNVYLENDIYNHEYTCRLEYGNVVSDQSNVLTAAFSVFESVKAYDESDNEVTSVTRFTGDALHLECIATLLPLVPEQVNYTWFENGVEIGDAVIDRTTQAGTSTYTCEAQVGSHTLTATVTALGTQITAPSLTIMNTPNDEFLLFSNPYDLFCDAGSLADIPGLEAEFSEDGVVQHTVDISIARYTIYSNLTNRAFTCRVVGDQNSLFSNSVTASFRTIDQVQIQTLDGDMPSSVLNMLPNTTVSLRCHITLSPDVPEDVDITYNWYDLHFVSHGDTPELEVNVTSEFMTTYRCWGEVGDFRSISTNNVRIQNTAALISQPLLPLAFALVCHLALGRWKM